MAVSISMLRGVNVGGHNKIKMEALRELYLRSDERDITRLTNKIEDGIERKFDLSARCDFTDGGGDERGGCEEPSSRSGAGLSRASCWLHFSPVILRRKLGKKSVR